MAELGEISLLVGFALALYAAVGSVVGHLRGSPELVVSARRALYMTAAASAMASIALITAFLSHDFTIKYVHDHSNLVMDQLFSLVAFYSGNEGSLLYILLVLALMSAAAVWFAPKRFARSIPYTIGVLAGVQAFYFMVLIWFASPFAPLEFFAEDGRGLNPLLNHPGLYTHPPIIMAGLAGITIPFAYAAGALISGNYGDDWVDVGRVSSILIWGTLGIGMLIGAWWAYTILGWGGYWSWDPIENVALMPFLVMTAFIHSIMVQKRRGMFRMWNIALINIAFVLAQLGTFINRGGPVVSVHSFASSTLGVVFLLFMLFSLLFAFGIFLWRYPRLKGDRSIESFLSREAAFLLNNWLLLAITAVTLWGVIFPVFSKLARETDVSVSAPYFNQVNGPMLLALLAVMGIGPLLPWRRASARSIRFWFIWPVLAGLGTFAGLLIAGINGVIPVFAFSVVAFVATTIGEEWFRGTRARHSAGERWDAAFWKLINGNRPRHGGYIVHLSILVLGVGIIGTQFYDQRTDIALDPGESAVIDNYRVEYLGRDETPRSDRLRQTATIDVYRINPREYRDDDAGYLVGPGKYLVTDGGYPGDRKIDTLEPFHDFYFDFNQVSVRAGIRSTPAEDLFVIAGDFLENDRVVLRVSINPLAMWLWISGPIFLLGTMIALWPQPALERRTVRSPERRRRDVVAPSGASENEEAAG